MRNAVPYLAALFLAIPAVAASEEGEETLAPLVITATGYEMPQDRIARDVTIITREEIARLPVHDVGEALNYLPGLVMDKSGSPGLMSTPILQGSDPRQIKILVDGVPMDLLTEGFTDLATRSLENIERIEVLKGAASSVWGSSLGGVINIITRKPDEEWTSEAGFSAGEADTRRYHGLVSGASGNTGILISASRFETGGFHANEEARTYNLYGKASQQLTDRLKAEVALSRIMTDREDGELFVSGVGTYSQDSEVTDSYQRFGLSYKPSSEYDLSLSLYNRRHRYESDYYFDYAYYDTWKDKESSYGGSLQSVWRHSESGTLLAGAEGGRQKVDVSTETKEYHTDKSALFVGESLRAGSFDLSAGARYDDDSVFGSEVSPSAGVVYHTGKAETLLRFNVARGFAPPQLLDRYLGVTPNADLHAERAWTYQAGFETRALPGFSSRVTFHRADITDGITTVEDVADVDSDPNTWILMVKNIKKSRRRGAEVNLRSDEYKGLRFTYGFAYNEMKDLETGEKIKDRPRKTHDVGIEYKGPYEMRATVKGRYVDWDPDTNDGLYGVYYTTKDRNFIWDAKVSRQLTRWKGMLGEIFLSVHNIGDSDQYRYSNYKTPGRWFEAGVNMTFY